MNKCALKNLTITDILETINKKHGEIPAVQIKENSGVFRKLTFIELGNRAVDVSSALIKLGVTKGDRVAILSESRPEWPVAYFGIISMAAVVVPLDIKLSEKEIQFILNDSQAKCVFVSKKYLEVIDNMQSVLPNIENVICLDEVQRKDVIQLNDLKIEQGDKKYNPIEAEDTALIVYTSGTTGVAKGVELSYKNLLFQVMAISDVVRYTPEDEFLSILPLNHMLEMTGGLIAPLYSGACITYCDSLKTSNLISLMKETGTTTMICVPLVLKMLHDGIMKKVSKMPAAKQKLFQAMLGISRFLLKFNIRVGRILFKSVHSEFGSRLRSFVSGGAPLDPQVEINFNALGFRVLQGYGLTETAPVITVNTFENNLYGSVGQPLPGVEVKIVKEKEGTMEGEILTRGPHVMKGYYKNREKTEEILKDGWLHTGDIGYLDKKGFLFISGRSRNLIVLGAGKKVFPEEVEEVLGRSPLIKEICVLGRKASSGRRAGTEEVYAVVVPELDKFKKQERADLGLLKKIISAQIIRLSEDLAEYKKVMDFEISLDELPKTSTRKIKRKIVAQLLSRKHDT